MIDTLKNRNIVVIVEVVVAAVTVLEVEVGEEVVVVVEVAVVNVSSSKVVANNDIFLRKNDPPPGDQVFPQTGTIFEFLQDIIKTNVLTKFHEDLTIDVKNAPTPDGHVFQPTGTIFELVKDTITMASRVLTLHMLTTHDGRRTKGDHKSSPLSTTCSRDLK
ncbi:hypothetical protein DPMN_044389 [Dreissena polymorpha]|uniref:Uncharacterized protein n=1 Tax=Dreissena polymorpha TaxID=45954 RepID=A0A9D4D4F1_DREPO|nr:hypothetical protein DPMN_044389 [Dreissena polymorpha]